LGWGPHVPTRTARRSEDLECPDHCRNVRSSKPRDIVIAGVVMNEVFAPSMTLEGSVAEGTEFMVTTEPGSDLPGSRAVPLSQTSAP